MDEDGVGLYYSNMADTITNTIPIYNLYGESRDLPDVLHCETIVDRAQLHDWNIAIHRHTRLHQFFVITSGGGEAEIDGGKLELEPPMLINVPPSVVHRFRFEPFTEGLVITVPVEVLEAGIGNSDALAVLLRRAGTAQAGPDIVSLFHDIATEHADTAFGRAHALGAAVALAAARVARALKPVFEGRHTNTEAGYLRRFEALIETHFREHWKVADYARELTISPTHLSRVTRAESGQAASALIEARLMREARRALAYTNMTIAQIAYETGFDDPAYFTRAFTRSTGVPPSAWRRRFEASSGETPKSRQAG
ncbi:MAG: helix-turn-helix domain-containing protein [Salaquimonas sp.]|nr:helix-turn-helix domain-containing protein [Salaquimonas sp.]